ncbi:sulfatase [Haloferax sp. DFSO52]|uniref:sulfatase n=1 Tax=Haloferax sp. DFSO52 TaxID=3388505 RepID=UPI003A8578D9
MKRSVIWITLESVRQDRTSLGEYQRDTTPFMKELANETHSKAFDKCFSHDIWTRASTASILTGLPSSKHKTWTDEAQLPSDIITLPEQFQQAGYETVGISSNPQFGEATGLSAGFSNFHYVDANTILKEAKVSDIIKFTGAIRRHSAGLTKNLQLHNSGYFLNQIGKRYIKNNSSEKPLFLYIHHGDSHHAYSPPAAKRDIFGNPPDGSIDVSLAMSNKLHELIATGLPLDENEWESIQDMYDTVIHYVDELVKDLVKTAREYLDDPMVVITGDHGELFGEDGLLAHMITTHPAVSNVPLVISGIDELPERNSLIQHADVMKMLVEEVGIDAPVPAGVSSREVAITERSGERAQQKLDKISRLGDQFDGSKFPSSDVASITDGKHRLVVSKEATELRDYNTNSAKSDVKELKRLKKELEDWQSKFNQISYHAGNAEFSAKQRQRLSDLGYL